MEYLSDYAYSVSITLIISVIFSLLLPSGTTGKFTKGIITVFILISFFIPMKIGGYNFDFSDFKYISETVDNTEEESYENIISENIKKTLTSGGYENCSVSADIEVSGDEITIKSAEVSIPDEYETDEVNKYIFDNIGINAEVYHIGE